MVQAVVFDLYETLVTQSGTPVPRAGGLGALLGLDPTAYRHEWKQLRPLVLRGELTFEQALMETGTRLGAPIAVDRLRRACDDRIRATYAVFQKIDPDIVMLTRDLCRRGARLATISNCMAEDAVAWPTCALAPQFACAMFSFAAGVVKPDTRIYLNAIDQLGVNARDTLYVGDGGDDELGGAARAGLRAVQAGWFVSRENPSAVPFLSRPRDLLRLVEGG
jgi:FMN phosphatase YigB (HAD superfamily)